MLLVLGYSEQGLLYMVTPGGVRGTREASSPPKASIVLHALHRDLRLRTSFPTRRRRTFLPGELCVPRRASFSNLYKALPFLKDNP